MNNYKGFYKVSEDNGNVCVGTFYNPDTKEVFTKITWDIDRLYDYDDEEIKILCNLTIDKKMRWQWLHDKKIIQEGDRIKVVKGYKIPVGTVATVKKIKPFYDCYRRCLIDYLYLDNGVKINADNCILV